MPFCERCGSHVTHDWVRVYGTENGCPNCRRQLGAEYGVDGENERLDKNWYRDPGT